MKSRWPVRIFCLCVLMLAAPVGAHAQQEPPTSRPATSLRLPFIAFGAAAMADWASTYHALKNYQVREQNPLLRPLDHEPGKMVALGAAIDLGTAVGWHHLVGKNHPRLASAGLWAATAFRAYLAIHNIRNERRSLPR